jgi:lysophospholipase L1-like esterase
LAASSRDWYLFSPYILHAVLDATPESSPRGWRQGLFALGAVLLALVVAWAVGEALLRIIGYSPRVVNPIQAFHYFDPTIGWRGKKLYSGRFRRPEFDVRIEHDQNGFRRQVNLEAKTARPRQRIFVFGDSYVWGWGVDQGEVFTDRMNLLLRDSAVYNYGINGVGTVVEFVLFDNEVKALVQEGDVLLLMFCKNDFVDNVDPRELHGEVLDAGVKIVKPAQPHTSAAVEFIKQHSYLCNFLCFRWDLFKLTRARQRQEDERLSSAFNEVDPKRVITRDMLLRFHNECHARKARFVVAYIPGQAELGEAAPGQTNQLANERACRETFFDIAKGLNIETVDLLPQLQESRAQTRNRLTFPHDAHWTALGHEAVAQILAEYLTQQQPR